MFVDENENVTVLEELVRERLKMGMNTNAFLAAHTSIVRVTYVETDINGLPTIPPERDTEREGNTDVIATLNGADDGDELVLPIVLSAAACIIIAVGAIVARRFSS